jgi:predicted nucleic acid-binding protein
MTVYIDTNVFVYAIERNPKYGKNCERILSQIQEKKLDATCSVLVLVELINVLVKLNKILAAKGQEKLRIADNIAAMLSLPIAWIDLDFLIIETASGYDHGINGVDYVHIASMETNSVLEIISADRELDKVKSIRRIDPGTFK